MTIDIASALTTNVHLVGETPLVLPCWVHTRS
jgi:hypothetical protein